MQQGIRQSGARPGERPGERADGRLRLAQAPLWDRWQWLWGFRDSGLLAELRPAETKVMWLMFAHADIEGISAPGLDWLAEASGFVGADNRAVRDARTSLVDRGLLAEAQRPAGSKSRAKHYRLTLPAAAGPAVKTSTGAPSPSDSPQGEPEAPSSANPARARPLHGRAPCTGATPNPAPPCHLPLHHGAGKESKRRETEEAAAGGAREPVAPLFRGPPRDAAAAAVLIGRAKMPAKVAHGLVTQHRPTAEQLRQVIVNAAARNWAHRRGELADPVRSLAAFIRAAIQRSDYALDERVMELRRRGRRRAEAASRRRAQQQRDPARRLAAMTDAERAALERRVLEDLAPPSRRVLDAQPPERRARQLHQLMIDRLKHHQETP